MNHKKNIERIRIVHNSLEELQDRVVYVGGSTLSLYADREAFEVRETDDVDAIVEIVNYPEHIRFEEELLSKGFSNDIKSNIRCRYKISGITVDIMPTEDIAMGFRNQWYTAGFKNAIKYQIDASTIIKILSSSYFIASKLEAFNNRGRSDGRTSRDFEDIVYVFENRSGIWNEIQNSDEILKSYLVNEFREKLLYPGFHEWIDCHVEQSSAPATDFILDNLRKFINS